MREATEGSEQSLTKDDITLIEYLYQCFKWHRRAFVRSYAHTECVLYLARKNRKEFHLYWDIYDVSDMLGESEGGQP